MRRRKRIRRRCWTAAVVLGVGYVMVMSDHRQAAGLLAAVVVVVTGGVLVVKLQLRRWRDLRYVRSGLAEVDAMSGVQFEHYVAAKMRGAGFSVQHTAATGDFGVDLIVVRGRERIAVQCKRSCKPVGVAAVQQVVSGAAYYRCACAMVASNQQFTKAAHVLAAQHRCSLVGRSRLVL